MSVRRGRTAGRGVASVPDSGFPAAAPANERNVRQLLLKAAAPARSGAIPSAGQERVSPVPAEAGPAVPSDADRRTRLAGAECGTGQPALSQRPRGSTRVNTG